MPGQDFENIQGLVNRSDVTISRIKSWFHNVKSPFAFACIVEVWVSACQAPGLLVVGLPLLDKVLKTSEFAKLGAVNRP